MRICLLVSALVACAAMAVADEDAPPVVLTVVNERGETSTFTLADLQKLPRQVQKATEHSGEEREFEGVALGDVLKAARVTLGHDLRGPLLANSVLVEAGDKYRVAFALPEFDPDFTDNRILLADTQDGKPVPDTHGPLRLVVKHEKRHSRWVKQVVKISVLPPPAAVAE